MSIYKGTASGRSGTGSGPAQPPYCNTGGYGPSRFISDLHQPADKNPFVPHEPHDALAHVTKVDWLRVTVSDVDAFTGTLNDLEGILFDADIAIQWMDKGLHGYEKSAALQVWRDSDVLTVGHIGRSEGGRNRGGLFELTGTGCKILCLEYPALWDELYSLLVYHEWRISRVDVALDLPGDWCRQHGYTVPTLFRAAVNAGLLKSDRLRNPNLQQSFSTAGDWSALVVGNITPDDYDPLQHCPAGLTAYIGNRKSSDDFFRIYEKGKELLGAMAEPESIDRAWVRIEHEMSRKASGRTIPLDVMLRPDDYFCTGRSGAALLGRLFPTMRILAEPGT